MTFASVVVILYLLMIITMIKTGHSNEAFESLVMAVIVIFFHFAFGIDL